MDQHESPGQAESGLDPMRIAQHPLFTAREKIELLEELKDGVTRSVDGPNEAGFSPEEIEAAIDEVRHAVERGATDRLSRSDA